MQNKETQITQEDVAEKLLWGLWRGVTEDYKTSYPREIWEHFENAIKSSSYTDSLKVFLNKFKRTIPTELLAKHNNEMLEIVQSGKDDIVLSWMREETTYLCMLVRLRNQERKESLKNN